MIEVRLWAGLIPLADNQKVVRVQARTIRELFRKLEERYPAMAEPLQDEVAVAINGRVFRDDWSQPLPEDAEIFLMRRLAGG